MHCLYCGKPLGFLKELTDGEFCSAQHRQRYKKLTKVALARLLETQPEAPGDHPHEHPEIASGPSPRGPVPAVAQPRKIRDFGGLFRQPVGRPLSAKGSALPDAAKGALSPALPGFTMAPIQPALGNAAAVWSKLEPAPPGGAGFASGTPLEPSGVAISIPRTGLLSGMLRQEGNPSLREARFVPPSITVPQPQPSSPGRVDGLTRPILEFRTAVAMPALAGLAATPSLVLAQSIPSTVVAKSPAAADASARTSPLVFPARTLWQESPHWRLRTIGVSLFTEAQVEKTSPHLHFFGVPPAAQAPATAGRVLSSVESPGWRIEPRGAVSSYTPGRPPALRTSSLQEIVRVTAPAAQLQSAPASAPFASAVLLPKLSLETLSAMPGKRLQALRLYGTARKIESAAKPVGPVDAAPAPVFPRRESPTRTMEVASLMPTAGFLPGCLPPTLAMPAMMKQAEPMPMAVPARLPVLRAMPVRETLVPEGSMAADVRVLNPAFQPLRAAGEARVSSGTVIPILASVLRHARMAKAQRTSPVVFEFEGIAPRQQVNVPLAYMELPMPIRQPRLLDGRILRIVETFEYLRPLEHPGLNPLEALMRLWRNTPVFVRFAAACASLIIMLWAAAPNAHVAQVAEAQWGEVRKSVADRAAVQLTDDFPQAMTDWEGEGNWTRSWGFDPAGFVRPGKLAFYRPSMTMKDYSVEFLAQIEKKGFSWVYRAMDRENLYVSSLQIKKPGPLPSMSLIRYPVIDGKKGPSVEIPIRVLMHNDTPYRVQLTVNGRDFTTSIEGQLIDYWRDDRLRVGGVGFFSDTGEKARLYWMKLSHQDDFIGRVCAYFYPNPIQTRRGN